MNPLTLFTIARDYYPALLSGLSITFAICLIVWAAGLALGVPLGLRAARSVTFGRGLWLVGSLLQGMPVLCILFILHYPVQAFLGISVPPFWTATSTFAVVHVIGVASLIRTTVADFPQQYVLAGKAVGLDTRTIRRKIVLPIILRQLLPNLLPLQNAVLHATLFASLISVPEVFRETQRIVTKEYAPVEAYVLLGLLMFLISGTLVALTHIFRAKFTRVLANR